MSLLYKRNLPFHPNHKLYGNNIMKFSWFLMKSFFCQGGDKQWSRCPTTISLRTQDSSHRPPPQRHHCPWQNTQGFQLLLCVLLSSCISAFWLLSLVTLTGRPDLMKIQPNGSSLSPVCQLQRALPRLDATYTWKLRQCGSTQKIGMGQQVRYPKEREQMSSSISLPVGSISDLRGVITPQTYLDSRCQ